MKRNSLSQRFYVNPRSSWSSYGAPPHRQYIVPHLQRSNLEFDVSTMLRHCLNKCSLPYGSATIVKASEIATVLVNSTARLHVTRWFRACCKDQGKTCSCEKHPAERACKAPVRISSSLLDVLRPLNPTAKCSDTLSTCLLSQQDPRRWKDLESILVYFLW